MAETFRLIRPDAGIAPVPVLYDSPHSGRHYPDTWRRVPPILALRRAEDAYVDDLVAPASAFGIARLEALLPRSYIDTNRAPDDIDPDLLAEPWPGAQPSEKSRAGIGLIRRHIIPGVAVYDRTLTHAEVRARLDEVYHPYHAALASELAATVVRFGRVWHIDWHSMKSRGNAMTPDGDGAARPDFIVGDLDGRSADPAVSDLILATLRDLGANVAHNVLYKGAEIIRRHGRPDQGIHSVQIELNRALYLNEPLVEPAEGFSGLRDLLTAFSRRIAAASTQ